MKTYCKVCQKEIEKSIEQCECGSRTFVTGEVILGPKGFLCICGHNAFKSTMHMDMTDKAINSYSCTRCGNPITIEHYRDENSKAYWGE